ncbi:hypothetical protein BK816_08110 [Boudabousia tangfeifanii]|uniref:Uncharacterized protein n=1 Tax=Boudabousia tangfeifanii TaxID=1912795 RepID=A0A1D9MLS9_9ACTO|nr:hypothetical protein [Boudabousia tangfeifanii]AOZ73252.1 hypothetical protein BK816_08110 [Boudabousia tangfeifanii]
MTDKKIVCVIGPDLLLYALYAHSAYVDSAHLNFGEYVSRMTRMIQEIEGKKGDKIQVSNGVISSSWALARRDYLDLLAYPANRLLAQIRLNFDKFILQFDEINNSFRRNLESDNADSATGFFDNKDLEDITSINQQLFEISNSLAAFQSRFYYSFERFEARFHEYSSEAQIRYFKGNRESGYKISKLLDSYDPSGDDLFNLFITESTEFALDVLGQSAGNTKVGVLQLYFLTQRPTVLAQKLARYEDFFYKKLGNPPKFFDAELLGLKI